MDSLFPSIGMTLWTGQNGYKRKGAKKMKQVKSVKSKPIRIKIRRGGKN